MTSVYTKRASRSHTVSTVNHNKPTPEPVDRTPCYFCGTRRDLGCSHNMNQAYFLLRDASHVNAVWDAEVRRAKRHNHEGEG